MRMNGRAIEYFATGQFLPVKDAITKECFNDRLSHSIMASIKPPTFSSVWWKLAFNTSASIIWGGMIPYPLHLPSHVSMPERLFPGCGNYRATGDTKPCKKPQSLGVSGGNTIHCYFLPGRWVGHQSYFHIDSISHSVPDFLPLKWKFQFHPFQLPKHFQQFLTHWFYIVIKNENIEWE